MIIQNLLGLAFLMSSDAFINTSFGQVMQIPRSYPVFKREVSNNMYKVTPYFLAMNLVSLMSFWFYPVLCTLFTFYAYSLPVHTIQALFGWMGALTLVSFCGSAFGMMWGCILTNEITALMLNQMCVVLFNMGSGMMVNTGSSSNYVIKALSWISPLHYSVELLMYRLLDGKNELLVQEIDTYLGFTYGDTHCYIFLTCFFFVTMFVAWIFILQRST
jgi:hypothetical protein